MPPRLCQRRATLRLRSRRLRLCLRLRLRLITFCIRGKGMAALSRPSITSTLRRHLILLIHRRTTLLQLSLATTRRRQRIWTRRSPLLEPSRRITIFCTRMQGMAVTRRVRPHTSNSSNTLRYFYQIP